MKNPLISVIIPVYKVEAYLCQCVDSVLAQTYTNLEIILVDDGSPDRCGQICDAYARKDKRVQVIHKENEGAGCARNSGLEICSGEFVLFLDSDDYLTEEAVEVLCRRIIADSGDMAVGRHVDLYEDGRTDAAFCSWMKDRVVSGRDVLAAMGDGHRIAVVAWAKLYRRGLFEAIRYPDLSCSEDLMVFPALVSGCDRISIVDKVVCYYRQRGESILHRPNEARILDDLRAGAAFVRFLWENGYQNSALWWYRNKVDKALLLQEKQAGRIVFETTLGEELLDRIQRAAGYKARVKWWALGSPMINRAVQIVKRLRKRG